MTDREYSMTERTKYIISALILLGGLGGMAGLYSLRKAPENKEVVDLLPTVATYRAEAFDGELGMKLSGIVVPFREINLAAEVAGLIDTKTDECRAGNFVTIGTPLLTIEKQDYELEINRLKSELKQSEVMIDELTNEIEGLDRSIQFAQEDLRIQKAEFDRRRGLKNALSESEIDQAKRGMNTADRALSELNDNLNVLTTRKIRMQSGMELSQFQLEKANRNLLRTDITAPFDGVIVMDMVEEGDFVQKGDELVRLEDTSKAEVKCNLRLDQIERILKYQNGPEADALGGQAYQLPPTPVTIYSSGLGQTFRWQGTLVRFDGIGVDEQTKMFPCSVIVDEPVATSALSQKALVRGMFVKVNLQLDTSRNASHQLLIFPEVAIHPGGFVWTVADKKLLRHKINLIDRQQAEESLAVKDKEYLQKMAIVTVENNSLKAGDAVVVTPLSTPTPGTEVKTLEKLNFPPSETDPANQLDAKESTRLTANEKEGQS